MISLVLAAGGILSAGAVKQLYGWMLIPFLLVSSTIVAGALWWRNLLASLLFSLCMMLWLFLYRDWWWLVCMGWRKEVPELKAWLTRYVYRKAGITWHARVAPPVAAPPPARANEVVAVRSAKASGERFSVLPPLKLEDGRPKKGEATLVLDPSVRFQTFMGFGTALTESSAKILQQMGSANQERIVDAYFRKDTGLGFNIGRLHLNSCDFSEGNWACCETPTAGFSVARYEPAIFPLTRRAAQAAGGSLTLFASPWSPPAWMKDTGVMCRGGRLKPECREAWAEHYVHFARALAAAGLPLWGFSVQNEPDAETAWENCLYSPEEERDFIRDHLGPALEASGMDLKLIAWDHNRDELFLRAHTIYSDPAAAKFVWGMGWHWYGDPRHEWWPDSAGQVCFENVRRVHELRPDKHLMVTETCQEVGPHIGDWTVGERYAESIIKDFNNWCEAWVDWNMLLDQHGGPNHVGNECSAPLIADTERDQVLFQPSYYVFGHFSRHIQAGAQRILCAASRDNLEATAFLNPDGTLVVVVLNQTWHHKDFCLILEGKTARAAAPPHSITTYILLLGSAR